MTNSEEIVDDCSFKVWYICNICKNRAYKNLKQLLQHKIDFHLPQNQNENKNSKQTENSANTKIIGGESETTLKLIEAQQELHLESMVNSLQDKSNRLVRLARNSSNRNLTFPGENSFKKRKKNSQKRGQSNVRSKCVVRVGKKAKKHNPPDFVCKTCNRRYTSKSNLIIHERVHSGERPFPCNFQGCKHAAISQWSLTRHQRRHETGRILLSCHLCKQYFNCRSSTSKRGDDQVVNRCQKCSELTKKKGAKNVTHLQNPN